MFVSWQSAASLEISSTAFDVTTSVHLCHVLAMIANKRPAVIAGRINARRCRDRSRILICVFAPIKLIFGDIVTYWRSTRELLPVAPSHHPPRIERWFFIVRSYVVEDPGRPWSSRLACIPLNHTEPFNPLTVDGHVFRLTADTIASARSDTRIVKLVPS